MRFARYVVLAIVVCLAAGAAAQTTVQGTVTDPNGNVYSAGTVNAFFPPTTPQTAALPSVTNLTATLNSSGFFTMSLSSSTTYIFTVCAAASAVLTPPVPVANPNISSFCFVAPAITTSASGTQDISASLNPSAVVIGPRAPTTIQLLATAGALTAGIPVKADTSNARGVVSTATGDTGGGIALGILVNSPASGGVATIMTSGLTNLPVLGTSTCAIGQFVVVDTTTNGRVKCTTYTAGTSLGVALAAQSTVGGNVQMIVQIR